MPSSWKESFQFFWYSSIQTNEVSLALCWKRFFFTRKVLTKFFFLAAFYSTLFVNGYERCLFPVSYTYETFTISPDTTREYIGSFFYGFWYTHPSLLEFEDQFLIFNSNQFNFIRFLFLFAAVRCLQKYDF